MTRKEMHCGVAAFLQLLRDRGIPLWYAGAAFEGRGFDEVTVNRLDRHPNELAHRLAAEAVADDAAQAIGGTGRNQTADPPGTLRRP